jgi:hypothetical protein
MVEKTAPVRAEALRDGFGIFQQGAVTRIAQKTVQPSQQDEAVFEFEVLLKTISPAGRRCLALA